MEMKIVRDEKQRHFAVKKIIAICGVLEYGNKSPRSFRVPELNWTATKVEEIISWEPTYEPILTADLSKDEICKFPDKPFEMKAFPCHTQSVERMVKEVSAASCHVFGAKKRDGFVRGRCFGRKVVPKADTKSDFLGMLKN